MSTQPLWKYQASLLEAEPIRQDVLFMTGCLKKPPSFKIICHVYEHVQISRHSGDTREMWNIKAHGNIGFKSSATVRLHYLVVFGVRRNWSKPTRHRCREFQAFQEGKLSLRPSHGEKKNAFDHLRSQGGMHYSVPHTHTHPYIICTTTASRWIINQELCTFVSHFHGAPRRKCRSNLFTCTQIWTQTCINTEMTKVTFVKSKPPPSLRFLCTTREIVVGVTE